jgi:hypothetical protein
MKGREHGRRQEGVLLPLRGRGAAMALGDPFSPEAVLVRGRRAPVLGVLGRHLLEGEWWRGEEEEALVLRLLLEGGAVVTAIAPLGVEDG